MSPVHQLVVEASQAGERLDVWVARALGLSRAQVKELAEGAGIRVNGRRAKRGDKVEAGATITVAWEEPSRLPVAEAPAVPLRVLYEDDALVVVDKPAHAPSHPLKSGETGTVANALAALHPECVEASEDPREAGLCHRLDTQTSGVLVAARSRAVWTRLREAFDRRAVDKRYWALVKGPLADSGEIELALRHAGDRVEPALAGGSGAREAISHFSVKGRKGEFSLVEVQILTGVLHQVRAHLAAIGAPIVGDVQYGGSPEARLDRFFLHARSIGFTHPETGKPLLVESPLPPELEVVRVRYFG